jgi:hypothetical protein
MGGLRWTVGDRREIDDRRFDPPPVQTIADAVDGPMRRCDRCKGGRLPPVIRVTVLTVFVIPKDYQAVLSCADCRNRLSYRSARTVNQQTVKVVIYE